MKYIICFLFFFGAACMKKPADPDQPRADSVAVLKDNDGWFIKITACYPTDFHRMIRVSLFFPEERWILVKLPAGKTGVTYRIDSALGDPVRWESHGWGSWPYPD